jgi:hypothetical protein
MTLAIPGVSSLPERAAALARSAMHRGSVNGAAHQLSCLSPQEVSQTPGFGEEWEQWTQSNGNLNVFFQSPPYWDYIQPIPGGEHSAVVAVRAGDGHLAGVVPVRTTTYAMPMSILGRRIATVRVRAIRVMGSQPSLPDSEQAYLDLFRGLFRKFPHCDSILMEAGAVGGFWWKVVSQSQRLRDYAAVYIRRGMTPHHVIALPSSFDDYLAKFKSKVRYNLRREVRRLRERGEGRLELVRVEHAKDVRTYLDETSAIEAQSWQYEALGPTLDGSDEHARKLARLADQGALRCYLLRCGGEGCAFVQGFQYRDVFYYSWCGFDRRLAEFSPGTVLLFLLIEDLCAHRRPRRATFLAGDAWYKSLFGTDRVEDATVLLVSRQAKLFARLRVGLYFASLWLAERLKLRGRSQTAPPQIDPPESSAE